VRPGDISAFEHGDSLSEGIFNTTSQFLCLLESHGTLIEINDAPLRAAGLDRGDVVGRKLWDTYWFRSPPETSRGLCDQIQQSGTGEPVREEHLVRHDGEASPMTVSVRPVLDGNDDVVFLVVRGHETHGPSERLEELERREARIEEAMSTLRHDFRKHLNVATGYLELATEANDGSGRESDGTEHLEKVGDSLDRMEQLVEDVSTLVRDGYGADDPTLVKLAIVANEAWNHVDTCEASLEIEDSMTVLADKSRLMQLLENLFRNAVEHGSTSPDSQARRDTERGSTSEPSGADAPEEPGPTDAELGEGVVEHGGGVTVRIGTVDGGFYVEDDGPGIPEEDREDVFTAGFTTSSEGSGFGLAIVERIAGAYGWTVEVTEGQEGGARFEIRTDADGG